MSVADAGERALRVLHVSTGLFTGGAETMLERLVTSSDPARYAHSVVSLTPQGPVGVRLERAGLPVAYLDMRHRLPLPAHVRRLRAFVRAQRPDVIQGWMVHGNLAALAAGRRGGPPVVWHGLQTVYDLRDEPFRTRWLIRLAARLSRRPARIIYNSRTAAGQHEALGYDAARTVVIPSGFDLERFRPDPAARAAVRRELGLAPDALVVGMIARYHPQKDHAMLLDALRRLLAWGVPATVVLAGRGADDANPALARARAEGLEGHLLLLGEREDVPRVCAALDVLALSSAFAEGFPNVLGEAMACGVPCVATDVGDSRWIVGDEGRIVAPRDPAAFAAALRELLELPPADRCALGARARERIAREFPLDAIRPLYERLYTEVAAGA